MKKKNVETLWEEDGDLDLMRTYFQLNKTDVEMKERIKKLTLEKLAQDSGNTESISMVSRSETGDKAKWRQRSGNGIKAFWWRWQWKLALPVAGLALIIFLGQAAGLGNFNRMESDMPQTASEYGLGKGGEVGVEGDVSEPWAANYDMETPAGDTAAMPEEYYGLAEVAKSAPPTLPVEPVPTVPPADPDLARKVTYNVNVRLEVEDVGVVISELTKEAEKTGGYVVESHQSGENDNLTGSITLKIPAQSLNSFQSNLKDWGEILSHDQWVNDITNQYYDAQARLRHWEAEEKRYVAILEKAESVDDILKVEASLANIREQTEQLKGQLKYWDNEVAYSTVQIYLEQPAQPNMTVSDPWHPVSWQKTWDAMKNATLKTISSTWNAFNYLAIGVGYAFPYMLLGGLTWGGYRVWKKRRQG